MSDEKLYQSQSMSLSNSPVSGQAGQAGRDLIQSQATAKAPLTSVNVVEKLAQIEELIQSSNLSDIQKGAAIRHIETAKRRRSVKSLRRILQQPA